jgi:hypothetical protein
MSKSLIQLDRVYSQLSQYGTEKDRIKYCRNLFTKTTDYLEQNKELLTDFIKRRSHELMDAALEEIQTLQLQLEKKLK